ncbi:MAG: exopolysaccharide biosynthesis polyprenyl glycosylphosphotransferase [Solirubrobacteraceae bacterium]
MSATDATAGEAPAAAGRPERLVARRYARRDFYLRRVLALSDLFGVTAALILTLALAPGGFGFGRVSYAVAGAPLWIVVFKLYGLYDRDVKRISHTTIDDVPPLFHALLIGSLGEWIYFHLTDREFVFADVLVFAASAAVFVVAGRVCVRAAVARIVSAERVLVIGSGAGMQALVGKMRTNPRYRLQPVAIMDSPAAARALGLPLVGRLGVDSLEDIVIAHRVGRVVLSDAEIDEAQLLTVLRECKAVSVKVSMLPAISSAIGPSVEVDDVAGITVLGINPPVLSRTSALLKRGVDLVGSAVLLVLTAPLMLALALLVRRSSPGRVFFRQTRIGKGGKSFELVKLRTMVADAEAQHAALLARSRDPAWLDVLADPRVTGIGRFLRTTSLDELPQLWNVLRGEMSLVGPRPLIAAEDSKIDGWGRGRLDLTPGMTGLWQVLGRTSLPFEEMVRLDYLYVTNWSLWGDARLMLRTLPVVLRRSGAN